MEGAEQCSIADDEIASRELSALAKSISHCPMIPRPAEPLARLDCKVANENDESNDTTTDRDPVIGGAVRSVLLAAMADTGGHNSVAA